MTTDVWVLGSSSFPCASTEEQDAFTVATNRVSIESVALSVVR